MARIPAEASRWQRYDVRRTPTIIFFRNGEELDRVIGAGKKAHYTAKLDALVG